MKLKDILKPESIAPDLKARTRDEALAELLATVKDRVPVARDQVLAILIQREDQSPTAMNGSVAVPHGRIDGLDNFVLGVGRSKKGIPFGADDGDTRLFFLLVAPADDAVNHLKVLARIARVCKSKALKEDLLEAETAGEIYRRIVREEEAMCA